MRLRNVSLLLGLTIALLFSVGYGLVGASANRVSGLPVGGTVVSSDIITDTVWTPAGSPYLLDGTIEVDNDVTLTVEPGVMVQGDNQFENFIIRGDLVAIGSPEDPITFTSVMESGSGEWGGLAVSEGNVQLEHAIIKHGNVGLALWAGQANLDNVRIENNVYSVETSSPYLHALSLSNVEFSNNDINRVLIVSFSGSDELMENVTLTSQLGLEGYEIASGANGEFVIPAGITNSRSWNNSVYGS